MIDFGATLRQAREAKGLTLNDVATTTHMMVQMVEDLENERFGRIAAPIYGRGFVKLYCEAVGIDDYKPLVAEFMEIFNGNRPPTIRMREEPPPAPPESAPEKERAAVPEPAPEPASEPERAAEDVQASVREPVADGGFRLEQETAAPAFAPLPEPDPAPTRPLSRYAPPTPLDEEATREPFTFPGIPPVVWRVLALLVVAGAILGLVFYLGRGLYRATMIAPEGAPPAVEETAKPGATAAPATAPAATSAAAPRTPLEVPPLYID